MGQVRRRRQPTEEEKKRMADTAKYAAQWMAGWAKNQIKSKQTREAWEKVLGPKTKVAAGERKRRKKRQAAATSRNRTRRDFLRADMEESKSLLAKAVK